MERLAGDAHISFEGNLRNLPLINFPGAATEETSVLKRNTTAPKQDFVVLPLEPGMDDRILAAVGTSVPRSILHIQIEKAGVLQFAAYDQFDRECLFLENSLQGEFLDSLIREGILKREM